MSTNRRTSLPITCLHPATIVNRRYTARKYTERTNYAELVRTFFIRKRDYELRVPCGKCYFCRKKRANEWRFRLMAEYTSTQKAVFFTLTFDDDKDIELYLKDKQSFIRRWRQNYKYHTGVSPRFFISEDVGAEFGRLHFHGLLFDPKLSDGSPLSTTWLRRHSFFWKYGFIHCSWVHSPRAITYVTGYLTTTNLKKEAMKHGKPICEKALKFIPHVYVSNGLGKSYLTPQKIAMFRARISDHYAVKLGGYPAVLPRYYRNHIWSEDEQLRIHYLRELDILEMEMRMRDLDRKGFAVPFYFQGRYLHTSELAQLVDIYIDRYEHLESERVWQSVTGTRTSKSPKRAPFPIGAGYETQLSLPFTTFKNFYEE